MRDERAGVEARPGAAWVALVLATGVLARLLLPFHEHNFDVDSYRIVADIMAAGGNVYAETPRYNYGPVWFNIVHWLDLLPSPPGADPTKALHFKIAAFLTLVDVGLFAILLRRFSLKVAALFFLNPISVIITGYHSQFDNLPVLIGFAAILYVGKLQGWRGQAVLLLGLGLSLMAKHLLFVFPLWLAMKRQSWRDRLLVVGVPYTLFLLGFAAYAPVGWRGILDNVFLYRSFNAAPLWRLLLPDALVDSIPVVLLFIGALLALGYCVRERDDFEKLRIYLIGLVVFSSAMANQYLAIPAASIAMNWNLPYAMYSWTGTLVLAVHSDGLALLGALWSPALSQLAYQALVACLAIGLALDVSGRSPRRLLASLRARIARR
ncbi:hypothetical protein E5222_11235 [Alteraurantiacibacter aquimixticola]|uniref:DUF2029 domain-containing protein n=2 Tax=Alteraurantiacibacter aquimixticola TaxID=2489173 RepID=A0A4T3EZ54_9SPHN|nr:hypothetical protein E5222_11235 [Alteraurantiacibacter aquimixticola]